MEQGTKSLGTPIIMPQLAESVVSATIGKWLKKPGDYVDQYEVICDIITDKVNAELPSTAEGILTEIRVGEGATVEVGTVICLIDETGGAAGSAAAGAEAGAQTSTAAGAMPHTPVRQDEAEGDSRMRSRYSPAVRTLVDEHDIDLSDVRGSGLGGRITRKDVLQYIDAGKPRREQREPAAPASVPAAAAPAPWAAETSKSAVRSTGLHLSPQPSIPRVEVEGQQDTRPGETLIDVTPIRHTIASRMRQSVSEIPHAWTMIEVDVTNLVLLRNRLKDEFMRKEGINLTYLAFLLKAVVNAIKDYPIMNSVWAVDKIIVKRDINISLAVGGEDSVLTPVIKKADQKNIAGLAREIDELARKTRAGKLTPGDMQGGTFTVNNTGSFGSILSYPIINYPQAAILTFESIVKRPVVINDMIAVRSMVNLCLSLDHRILDGVICGRFLQRVKENLEGFGLETKLY
jgi:2-oxoisovalerate dehydrogenase E2 component (dihydrolipoyl transacylase)